MVKKKSKGKVSSVIIKRKKTGKSTKVKGMDTKGKTEEVKQNLPNSPSAISAPKKESPYAKYPEWGERFIKMYREEFTIFHAAKRINTSRNTVTKYKKYCKAFRADIEKAEEDVTDMLEKSMMHRATHGVQKLVLYNGVPVKIQVKVNGRTKKLDLYETKYETALAIFMMKGRRRDKYYPELEYGGGTTDDKASAVIQTIAEIRNIMAPGGPGETK